MPDDIHNTLRSLENPYKESLIGTLRKECLDRYLFVSGQKAQQAIVAWQYEYNHYRPHSSLRYLTPVEFARQQVAVAGLNRHQVALK